MSPKRKRKEAEYKRSKVKKAKLKGLPYVSYSGNYVPGKTFGPDCRQVPVYITFYIVKYFENFIF